MTTTLEVPIQSEALPIDQIVVPVESDMFVGHENAAIYVGIMAVHNVVLKQNEYQGVTKLRANVYIDEHRFLSEEERKHDGGETDEDDRRAVHFGVFQNKSSQDQPITIGTSRLIVKEREQDLLPVERFFPEVFEDEPAPINSAEASRFISRNESKAIQRTVSLGLIRAMTACTVDNLHQPVYAVVEKSLARLFKKVRLPYTALTEPKMIPDYNTENMAIKIDPTAVVDSIRPEAQLKDVIGSDIMQLFFGKTMEHKGLGYFDETMTQVVK